MYTPTPQWLISSWNSTWPHDLLRKGQPSPCDVACCNFKVDTLVRKWKGWRPHTCLIITENMTAPERVCTPLIPAEAGGSLRVWGQSDLHNKIQGIQDYRDRSSKRYMTGLHSKTLSQKKKVKYIPIIWINNFTLCIYPQRIEKNMSTWTVTNKCHSMNNGSYSLKIKTIQTTAAISCYGICQES